MNLLVNMLQLGSEHIYRTYIDVKQWKAVKQHDIKTCKYNILNMTEVVCMYGK